MNSRPLAEALGMTRLPGPAQPARVVRDHRTYSAAEWRRVLYQRAQRAHLHPLKIRRTREDTT